MFFFTRLSRKKQDITCSTPGHSRQRQANSIRGLWHVNRREDQEIGVVDIDPEKLIKTLQNKYGLDFEVHVRANLVLV